MRPHYVGETLPSDWHVRRPARSFSKFVEALKDDAVYSPYSLPFSSSISLSRAACPDTAADLLFVTVCSEPSRTLCDGCQLKRLSFSFYLARFNHWNLP
jgi:hypothetical protein